MMKNNIIHYTTHCKGDKEHFCSSFQKMFNYLIFCNVYKKEYTDISTYTYTIIYVP